MSNWSYKQMTNMQKVAIVGLVMFVSFQIWTAPKKVYPRSVSEATVQGKIRELYEIDCHVELVWYINRSYSEVIVKVSAPVPAESNAKYQVAQYLSPTGQNWLGICKGEMTSRSFRYEWAALIR